MFQRMIEDLKDSTGTTLRMTALGALAGLGVFVTLIFLCAALFIAMLQRSGPIEACLAIATIFFVISIVTAGIFIVKKRRAQARAAGAARNAAKSAATSILGDPMLLAAGMQIIRAVGIKRLIPLLAVGGIALGIFASRNTNASNQDEASDAKDPDEE